MPDDPNDTDFLRSWEPQDVEDMFRRVVTDALRNHSCRFTREEAAALHAIGKLDDDQLTAVKTVAKLSADQIGVLGRFARTMDAVSNRLGQAILLTILAVALTILAKKFGIIDL